MAAFRAAPVAEGINLKGLRRTTLKLFVPNLTFPEPIEGGGETCGSTWGAVSGVLPLYTVGGR